MGRSKVLPRIQPDDISCGPMALKHALEVLGKRGKKLEDLMTLCKTNRNGTSTKNLLTAVKKLGLHALTVEYATLHHLQSALKTRPNQPRAVIVSYSYWVEDGKVDPDEGHWALVSQFSASKSRIVLLNSYTGKKISYPWSEFRERWIDYDLKRQRISGNGKKFRLIKKWQHQLMIVVARDAEELPKFKIDTAKLHLPKNGLVN